MLSIYNFLKVKLCYRTYWKQWLALLAICLLVFACSSDSSDDNTDDTVPIDDTNPVYLDTNGVTIKARDWAVVGESGIINGVSYTIVNRETLVNMIDNLEDLTRICTSRITNMDNLFDYKHTSSSLNNWDVSNVTTMVDMFRFAYDFNQAIGDWDVSNVTNMGRMFWGAQMFNQAIGDWDVSNVTDMGEMFSGAFHFNQDISTWDVSSVINMYYMFGDWNYSSGSEGNFNQDLSGWEVSSVTYCDLFNCLWTNGGTVISPQPNWTLPKPNFTNCETGCD